MMGATNQPRSSILGQSDNGLFEFISRGGLERWFATGPLQPAYKKAAAALAELNREAEYAPLQDASWKSGATTNPQS